MSAGLVQKAIHEQGNIIFEKKPFGSLWPDSIQNLSVLNNPKSVAQGFWEKNLL
jgi:hypothetical protein